MSLEVTGRLIEKYEAQNVTQTFKTREFVIELAEEINGNTYTNYAKMQLVQNKCDIIDRFNKGDMVKVSFNIRGRSYVDKKDGKTKYISNMDAWRVEAPSAPSGPSQGNQQPQGYNNPAPGYNNSPQGYNNAAPVYNNPPQGYNQAPAYNQQGGNGGGNFNQAPNYNQSAGNNDDLPF